jgi:transposase
VIQEWLLENESEFTRSRNTLVMRAAPAINLSVSEREILERRARGRSTPARLVLRSKIALLASDGLRNTEIARVLCCGSKTVCLWRRRFALHGIAGIEKEAPRGSKQSQASELLVQQIIQKTLHELPPRRSRWSTRSLAKALGTSPAMVQRVWKAHGLTMLHRSTKATP